MNKEVERINNEIKNITNKKYDSLYIVLKKIR